MRYWPATIPGQHNTIRILTHSVDTPPTSREMLAMSISVTCTCGKRLSVKDELAGKRVRCPGCQGVVAIPAAGAAPTPPPAAAPRPPAPPAKPAAMPPAPPAAPAAKRPPQPAKAMLVDEDEAVAAVAPARAAKPVDDEETDRPRRRASRDEEEGEDDEGKGRSRRRRRKGTAGSKKWLLWAGIGGGGVVVLAILIIVIINLFVGRKPPEEVMIGRWTIDASAINDKNPAAAAFAKLLAKEIEIEFRKDGTKIDRIGKTIITSNWKIVSKSGQTLKIDVSMEGKAETLTYELRILGNDRMEMTYPKNNDVVQLVRAGSASEGDGVAGEKGSGGGKGGEATAKVQKAETTIPTQIKGGVQDLSVSADGQVAIISGRDNKQDPVQIWDLKSKQMLHSFTTGDSIYRTVVAVSPDGKIAAYVSEGEDVTLLDVKSGKRIRELIIDKDDITQRKMLFSPSGDRLVLVGSNHLFGWDPNTGASQFIIRAFSNSLHTSSALFDDGRKIVVSGWNSVNKIMDIPSGKTLKTITGTDRGVVQGVAVSADGKMMASVEGRNTIIVRDMATEAAVRTIGEEGVSPSADQLLFLPDGKTLVYQDRQLNLVLHDIQSGAIRCLLQGHTLRVSGLALCSDGNTLVSASMDGTIRTWNLKSLP
jgi:hypothetical protein